MNWRGQALTPKLTGESVHILVLGWTSQRLKWNILLLLTFTLTLDSGCLRCFKDPTSCLLSCRTTKTVSVWQMLAKMLTTKVNKSRNPQTSLCCFSWKWKGGRDPKTGEKRGRREHQLWTTSLISSIFLLRTREQVWALVSQSKDEKETLAVFCLLVLQTSRQEQEWWSQPTCYFSLNLIWHIHKIYKAAAWFHMRSKACTEVICGKTDHCWILNSKCDWKEKQCLLQLEKQLGNHRKQA